MRLTFCTIFFFLLGVTYGQEEIINPPSKKRSHFFQTMNLCFLSDWIQSPAFNKEPGGTRKYNSRTLPLVAFYYKPRINLKAYGKEKSISLDMGAGFAFGSVLSDTFISGLDVAPYANFLYTNFPFTFTYNFGYHSTLMSEARYGGSVGIGGQITYGPLIEIEPLPAQYKKVWLQPIGFFAFKFDRRKGRIDNVDLTVGFLNGYTLRVTYGWTLNY